MKLNDIGKPSGEERFSKAMQDAQYQGPQRPDISFHELPRTIIHRVLSQRPYEDIYRVSEVLSRNETIYVDDSGTNNGPKAPHFFVIVYKDGLEQAFWPDGSRVKFAEQREMTDEELDEFYQQYEQEVRRLLQRKQSD